MYTTAALDRLAATSEFASVCAPAAVPVMTKTLLPVRADNAALIWLTRAIVSLLNMLGPSVTYVTDAQTTSAIKERRITFSAALVLAGR